MIEKKKRKEIINKLDKFWDNYPDDRVRLLDFENKIIKFDDPELSLWFLQHFNGCKITEHFNIIINGNSVSIAINAGNYVTGGLLKVSDFVLKKGNSKDSRRFIKIYLDSVSEECIKEHLKFICEQEKNIDADDELVDICPELLREVLEEALEVGKEKAKILIIMS